MEKIDLHNSLFHGLAHFLADKRFDLSLKRLDQILKCGAILSRNEQKKILPTLGFSFEDYCKILWNGEDYISICKKSNGNNKEDNTEAFFEFLEGGIGLILDKKLLKELETKSSHCQDGEIQVKNKIDSKYFLGVLVRDMSDDFFIHYLEDWPPILEEDITEHFIQINKIRKVLQQNGYDNLPIYSSIDGCIITNAKTIMSKLQQRNNQLNNKELTM